MEDCWESLEMKKPTDIVMFWSSAKVKGSLGFLSCLLFQYMCSETTKAEYVWGNFQRETDYWLRESFNKESCLHV